MTSPSSIPQGNNLETYTLIWLDGSANDSRETIQAQRYFRTVINYLKVFKEAEECVKYIQVMPKDDRVVMIVSGRLGQEAVPRIHQAQQVAAIYVYCMNRKNNEQWAKGFNKIKHIIVNLEELVKKIGDEQIARQRNKVSESFSIHLSPSITTDNSFRYTHVLINCLIQTNSAVMDKTELLEISRQQYQDNESELKIMEEFEQTYLPSRALWWYTRQSFLYRLLKKALQMQDMEFLLLFRFFIHDIERQLEKTKCTSPVRVCCGQMMSNEDFHMLKNHTGKCLIINSFLSTGTKQQILQFCTQIESSNDVQRILFEIDADPQLENIKPFSNITSLSYYPNEEQTLFMLGSIFRVVNLRQEHDGMWTVRMTLCPGNDPEVKSISVPNLMGDSLSFGRMFCDLGRIDAAETYYHQLLKNLPSEHEDIISCYDALGDLEEEKNDYDSSLQYFNKSLEMRRRIREVDDPDIGDGYFHVGEIYQKKHDVKRALDAFEKAIAIYSKTLNDDHPKIAVCYNNIGHGYMAGKEYPKALECYEKTLFIRKKCFSETHSQIADSFKNIANAQENLKKLDQALDNYNRALRIYEKSPSPSHCVVGTILNSIGSIYETMKQYQQAYSHYERALASFRNVLSSINNQIVQTQQNLQRISTKLK